MAKKCSIVIPTKDKPTRLYLTLMCLDSQVTDDVEVIVVFDGCTKETVETCQNFQWNFQPVYVVSEKNVGRAAARNLGLAKATGDVIIFLDDDRLTEKDFIQKHLAHHTGGEPSVVLGERMDSKNTEDELRDMMENNTLEVFFERVKKNSKKEFYYNIKKLFVRNPLGKIRYMTFITGNVSIERSAIEKIGGFDDGFKGWGYEDTDIGYRLYLDGLKYYQDNDIVCYHLLHPHSKAQKSKEELANLKYLKQKFPNDKRLGRAIAFYTLKAKLKL